MTEEDFKILQANQARATALDNRTTPVLSLDVPLLPKRNKYHARKKEVDGHVFDSSREAARYIELKALQAAGVISDLELQPAFVLQEAMVLRPGDKRDKRNYLRAIRYTADFRYLEIKPDHIVIEEVKGQRTEAFNIREKLFRAKYPYFELRIIR